MCRRFYFDDTLTISCLVFLFSCFCQNALQSRNSPLTSPPRHLATFVAAICDGHARATQWVRDMKKEMKDARRMMASGNYSAAFTGGSADSGSGSGSAGAGGGAQSKAERLRRARVGK